MTKRDLGTITMMQFQGLLCVSCLSHNHPIGRIIIKRNIKAVQFSSCTSVGDQGHLPAGTIWHMLVWRGSGPEAMEVKRWSEPTNTISETHLTQQQQQQLAVHPDVLLCQLDVLAALVLHGVVVGLGGHQAALAPEEHGPYCHPVGQWHRRHLAGAGAGTGAGAGAGALYPLHVACCMLHVAGRRPPPPSRSF
jgi:hypothetical protein